MDRETEALLHRASALRQSGQVEQAIAAYSKLLDREPDLPESWYNLGWLQRRAGRFEESLRSYSEALARGVSGPEEVHLNRAVILSDHLARHDEAKAELEQALSLKPDYLPALLNLGNLHEDRGDREAAASAYRRALEIAPGDALALARLAGVTDARSDHAAELVARIERELERPRAALERADLGFALGRLLDARAHYDRAFAVYAGANRASRESFGPAFGGYDRAAQERFVDRMIASFSEQPTGASGSVRSPIFICGMFRSGSTLVEQMIASHSAVRSAGELPFIPALAARIPDYPAAVAGAGEEAIDGWRRFYLDGLSRVAPGARSVTDKRPDNFLHLGMIKTIFPEARIVHTRRNRLDNLLSLYFLQSGPEMPYALDLSDAGHWHEQYERLMAHWQRLYAGDILTVDYDLLVREPGPVLERLLAFLDLDWEDSILDFHKRQGAVKTASVWQVREPLHSRSSGRWRNYAEQLAAALGSLEQR